MARGWESKSVEEQQSEAASKLNPALTDTYNSKPVEEQTTARRISALKLSRARLEQQLAATENPRYAEQLKNALAEIDRQLAGK